MMLFSGKLTCPPQKGPLIPIVYMVGPKNQLQVGWNNSTYRGEITPVIHLYQAIYRGGPHVIMSLHL